MPKLSPSSTPQPPSGGPSRTGTPTSATRPSTLVSAQPARTTTPSRPSSMGPPQIAVNTKPSMAGRRGSQIGVQAQQSLSVSPSPAGNQRPGSGASSAGSRTPVDQKLPSPVIPAAKPTPINRLQVAVKGISAANTLQRKGSIVGTSTGESDSSSRQRGMAPQGHGRKESTRAPPPANVPQPPASPELQRRPANDISRELEDLKTKIKV